VRILLTCWHCRHQADADLQSLIDGGRGNVPLVRLRWRSARCRSDRIDMICTSMPASCRGARDRMTDLSSELIVEHNSLE
jgi:hypothetical protein